MGLLGSEAFQQSEVSKQEASGNLIVFDGVDTRVSEHTTNPIDFARKV